MKPTVVLLLLTASQVLPAADVVDLWPGQPPHSRPCDLEEAVKDSWGVPCVYNVTHPTLTIHQAQGESSRRAMIVVPGGGYEVESFVAEGELIAEFLASRGITAAVLKYRLPLAEASEQPHLLPLTDIRRAISLMRGLAESRGFDPSKVGVLGFSAGGHLAAAASVLASGHPDEVPDFTALAYPPTTMSPDNQQWLEERLFHRTMTPEERREYSLADQVGTSTPPAFVVHAFDDDVVPIRESELYIEALAAAGREVEVHFFARGGHGFGPGRAEDGTDQWLGLLASWVRRQ
jgi:acetyl esterase/lipase